MSSYYFNYTFYIQDESQRSKLKNLINDESSDTINNSLSKLGFLQHLDKSESVEHLQLTDKGLNMYQSGHKVNASLLVASKKLGSDFVHINIDYDEFDEDQYFHRGQLVSKDHVDVLLRIYDPESLDTKNLFNEITTRNFIALKQAINNGLDLNSTVEEEPLLHDVYTNRPVFHFFLENGADPDVKDEHGYTLLMKLLDNDEHENADIILSLLEKGSDVRKPMVDEGGSLLWHAMPFGKKVVDAIKSRGGEYSCPENVYEEDSEYNASIAIGHHDHDKLNEILASNLPDRDSISELVDECITANNVSGLEALMDNGYDLLSDKNESNIIELLETALSYNSLDMSQYLMDKVTESEFELSEIDVDSVAEIAGNPYATDILQRIATSSNLIQDEGPDSIGLVNAIDANALDNIKVLIDAGCKLDDKSDEDFVISLLAANIQKLTAPITQLLISAGADPFLKTHKSSDNFEEESDKLLNDKSAIHLVLKEKKNRDPDLVALFEQLQNQLPAEKQIWQIIEQGNLKTLKSLFQQCSNKDMTNHSGETMLQVAAKKNNYELVKWLSQQNINLNHKDKTGNSALASAVLLQNASLAKKLLSMGANANDNVACSDESEKEKDSQKEEDKLMEAMGLGVDNEIDKERERINSPIQISGIDANCLMSAANSGNLHIVKMLLESGAEIDAEDEAGRTAIYFSAENGHLECVKYLHQHEAKTEIHIKQEIEQHEFGGSYSIDFKDRHILEAAAYRGHIEVCEYLVRNCGIDINLKSKSANHCAIISASLTGAFIDQDIMTPLLKLGADTDSITSQLTMSKASALQICILALNSRGAKILVEHGADRDKLTLEGDTAYDILIENLGENAALALDFNIEELKPVKSSTRYKKLFKQTIAFFLLLSIPASILIGAVYYFSSTWAKYVAIAIGVYFVWDIASQFFKKEEENSDEAKEETNANPFIVAGEAIGKAVEANEKEAKKDKALLDEWEEA